MADDRYNPLVPDRKPLNEVKYAARDYPSIFDELMRLLKVEYGTVYNDYATTSQGVMFMSLMAWAYAGLSWYLDRTASDCFLSTSRTRAAAERLVEQLAYKMAAAAPSSTKLVLGFPDGTTGPFIMKDRWRYSGPAGLQFESYAKITQGVALAPGAQIEVDVRQGVTRTITYTSDGTKNQRFRLTGVTDGKFLAVGATEVRVDGAMWTEYPFLDFERTNHYEISYMQNPPVVQFGDGISGNIPQAGASIIVRYLIIDGAAGNAKANTITASIDRLSIGGKEVAFTVNNPSKAAGGSDPEELDRAKKFAPRVFAARGAAITQPDYTALANTYSDPAYGRVAKAYALNPRTSYEDVRTNEIAAQIDDLLSDYIVDVSGLEAQVASDGAAMSPLVSSINGSATTLQSLRSSMIGWSGAISAAHTDMWDSMTLAESSSALSKGYADTALTTLNTARSWARSAFSGITKTQMLDYLDEAIAAATSASKEASTANTNVTVAKGALSTQAAPSNRLISDSVANSGVMDVECVSVSANAQELYDMLVGAGGTQEKLTGIVGKASVLANGDSEKDGVNDLVDKVQQRIGKLFSDDCLSNYVQVPILALDSDGNYTAPSIGLRVGLQNYLNQIKEVTQVVEVVDGSSIIIPALIDVKVKVLSGYVPAEVISQIGATITRLLRGRDFNSPLYLSDLYNAVKESSTGIDFVNIKIACDSSPGLIDGDGNLITFPNQVVSLGALSIQNLDEVI